MLLQSSNVLLSSAAATTLLPPRHLSTARLWFSSRHHEQAPAVLQGPWRGLQPTPWEDFTTASGLRDGQARCSGASSPRGIPIKALKWRRRLYLFKATNSSYMNPFAVGLLQEEDDTYYFSHAHPHVQIESPQKKICLLQQITQTQAILSHHNFLLYGFA